LAIPCGSKSSKERISDFAKTRKFKNSTNDITSIIGIPRMVFEWQYPTVNVSPIGIINIKTICREDIRIPIQIILRILPRYSIYYKFD